jgi:hypothetical protein
MVSVIWELAHCLDERRIDASKDETVELLIPTQQLRGPQGRSDNINLRQWLDRLTGLKLQGEYRGEPWAAVMIAQYEFRKGGSLVRIIIPPAAVTALRSGDTFAKIEAAAAHQLPGHARRLYAILADKRRLKVPEWTFELHELRQLMGVAETPSYSRWAEFSRTVLHPAIEGVNDYGTVIVKMQPIKRGRSVYAVKFTWAWKTLDDARLTTEENNRHSKARRKAVPDRADAPPLVEAEEGDPATAEAIQQLAVNIGQKLRVSDDDDRGLHTTDAQPMHGT